MRIKLYEQEWYLRNNSLLFARLSLHLLLKKLKYFEVMLNIF